MGGGARDSFEWYPKVGARQIAQVAEWMAERGLDVQSLFTNEFRLEEAERAYELFDRRQIGKGVFISD